MNKTTRKWTAGAVLALALCGMILNVSRGDDDEDKLKEDIKKASEAIQKNLGKVGGPDGAAIVAKLVKDHKMEATMRLMRTKTKGGISIGKLSPPHKDCIELLIRDYAIKPPAAKEVKDGNEDLIKSGRSSA